MKYDVYFDIKGPGGISRNIPNINNPIEVDLHKLLNLPKKIFGVEIEYIKVTLEKQE